MRGIDKGGDPCIGFQGHCSVNAGEGACFGVGKAEIFVIIVIIIRIVSIIITDAIVVTDVGAVVVVVVVRIFG